MISNTILWGNTPNELVEVPPASLFVEACDIEGGWTGFGEDNIDVDPMFGPASFDLADGSPCIDAGRPETLPADETDLDQDGNTREPLPLDIAGRDRVAGVTVDIGAYERPPGCTADVTGDAMVNGDDLLLVIGQWGAAGAADVNGDGVVDGADLLLVLATWGACP